MAGRKSKKKKTRRSYEDGFKRRLVAETERPGATVKAVGEKYDIAANIITRWRKDPALRPTTATLPTRRRRRQNGAIHPPAQPLSRLDDFDQRLKALEAQVFAQPAR